uniref:Kinesin-like protein n=1 Tax=Cyprinus carpio TaxID=7962 RepID=A0A8C2JS39_CYPCA
MSTETATHGGTGVCRAAPAEAVSRTSALPPQQLKMENSAVTVAVRVRPFSSREKKEKAHQVIFMNDHETVVQHPDTKQSYTFTFEFSFCSINESDASFASQQVVYEKLARPLLERAFEGFNTCLFAYGQTGSGKSYTMMGFGEEAGVIPRFCKELFSRLSRTENKEISCRLEMSYFEVYNEKIHDLLVAKDEQNQKKMPLRVREHPVYGPYVTWLELGNKQRATAATGMNDKSSRSHSVFTLVMMQTKTEFVEEEEHDHCITSRINLVDLAGSERCTSAQTSGDRLREGASINKSLLTLGKVISALSEQAQTRKKVFTPYRESVLTWLLKESLGGNSKTSMIATLSPAASNMDESLSTLRYAQQARMIINIAKVNEDTNAKLIRELKAEVEKLRAAQMSSQGIEPEKMRLFQQEITSLKTKLSQQEHEMAEAHRTWKEKLEDAERRKREESRELQRAGVTFKVDNRLPNLVNLNEDPQLSELLLYMIKEGETKVGKLKSESAHDIQLSGALIADEHCVISSVKGTISIKPMANAKTFVNGHLVSECTVLHHGDRVILGGDHYFRFNHPAEVQSGKRASCWNSGDGQKDFEFAKNELLLAQRAQLEAEIEAARLKAKEEMMQGIQVAKEMAQKELSEQKSQYEKRIKALERELEEESERKRVQELDKKRVVVQIEQLQTAKSLLEQEVNTHNRRLQIEAQATRQALADHDIRHAKIVEALEAEKRKIAEDLAQIERKRAQKMVQATKTAYPQWDALKLSLMIEEANKISANLRKHTVFSSVCFFYFCLGFTFFGVFCFFVLGVGLVLVYTSALSQERSGTAEDRSEEDEGSDLCAIQNTTAKLLKLNRAIKDLHSSLLHSLKGRGSDAGLSQTIQSLSRTVDDVINGLSYEMAGRRSDGLKLPCEKNIMVSRDQVHSALKALTAAFDKSTDGMETLDTDRPFVQPGHGSRNRTVPKVVYSLSSGISACSRDARWV